MKMIHIPIPGYPEATLEGYILDCDITLGQNKKRPAVVICPGGGYVYCSPREAEPIALAYASNGFHAFILRYSTGWDCLDFAPLKEVSWVIGHLREKSDEWNIDPDKIISCGFSAGGHLALASGVMGENRPNAMVLGYPMATMPNMPGMNYTLQLMTGRREVTDQDAERYDLLAKIDQSAPPVFIAATAEDLLTNFGALPIANRYTALGKGYELHVFQHGPHGYSLANEVTADGSSQVINPAFAQWLDLSVRWIYKVFGANEFTNKSTSKMAGYLQELGFGAPAKLGPDFA